MDEDDFGYEPDDEPLDPLEEAEMDCGLGDDGLCSMAGSEWCDFECPFRDELGCASPPAPASPSPADAREDGR